MARPEEDLHVSVCKYMKLQHPKVIFISEPSGLRVSMGLAIKLKKMRSDETHLDLYILEPRKGYFGLIIELKAVDIFQKKAPSQLLKNEHVEDQKRMIDKLNSKGYLATFSIGFDATKKIIDDYLNG